MKMPMIRRHAQLVPTVNAQTPQTLELHVGQSLVALTAQQARRLASLLLVQAEVISPCGDRIDPSFSRKSFVALDYWSGSTGGSHGHARRSIGWAQDRQARGEFTKHLKP